MCVCVCTLLRNEKQRDCFFIGTFHRWKEIRIEKGKANFVYKTFSSPLLREYEQRREKNTLRRIFFRRIITELYKKKKCYVTLLKTSRSFSNSLFFCVFFLQSFHFHINMLKNFGSCFCRCVFCLQIIFGECLSTSHNFFREKKTKHQLKQKW